MAQSEAGELIATIRSEIAEAADRILETAESGLQQVSAAMAGDPTALEALQGLLCQMLEACAFQDITGQRLSRLEGLIGAVASTGGGLLNGPALPGQGLGQEDVDALMRRGGG